MNKQEKLDRINSIIEKMRSNYFLLPKSYSDELYMSDYKWKYKTYRCSNSPWIYIEITDKGLQKREFQIHFRHNDIYTCGVSMINKISLGDILYYIESIYKECFSFEKQAEGKKAIRKKIHQNKGMIDSYKEDIDNLYKELEDLEKLEIGEE